MIYPSRLYKKSSDKPLPVRGRICIYPRYHLNCQFKLTSWRALTGAKRISLLLFGIQAPRCILLRSGTFLHRPKALFNRSAQVTSSPHSISWQYWTKSGLRLCRLLRVFLKFPDIRQYLCKIFAKSGKKSACASVRQALFGIVLNYDSILILVCQQLISAQEASAVPVRRRWKNKPAPRNLYFNAAKLLTMLYNI